MTMRQIDRERFAHLVQACHASLAEQKQSVSLWRGDMRAILAVAYELERHERREDAYCARFGFTKNDQ